MQTAKQHLTEALFEKEKKKKKSKSQSNNVEKPREKRRIDSWAEREPG